MPGGEIARVIVAASECLDGRWLVLEITFHDGIAALHDFADRRAIAGDRLHRLGIGDHDVLDDDGGHALTRHQRIPLRGVEAGPIVARRAVERGPVTLRGAVGVQHIEAHRLHFAQHGGGRRGPAGQHARADRQRAFVFGWCVDQHRQHDRRTAHVRHVMLGDQLEDALRIDLAQTHMGAANRGHRPGISPARAVEHRQRPQIARLVVELERQRVRHRAKVRAAMAEHDALRVPRGAGCVEQADALPLICDTGVVEIGVTTGDEILVLGIGDHGAMAGLGVGDVDHNRFRFHEVERGRNGAVELAVGEEHLRFAVVEAKGDRRRIEPDIDRVQDRAQHRDGEVRFEHRRRVGRQDRDGIASADAGFGQRVGEPAAAGIELAVGVAEITVDHRNAIGKNARRPLEKTDRRQRHVIGLVFHQFRTLDRHRHSPAGFAAQRPLGQCARTRVRTASLE